MSEHSVATLPLAGKRILVTRTREQASMLSERLSALGAIPIEFPTIRIVPPSDWTELDEALGKLFLTSPAMSEHEYSCVGTGSGKVEEWGLCACPGGEFAIHQTGQAQGPHSAQPLPLVPTTNPIYTWLIFTSANGVTICCERLLTLGYDLSTMRNVRIATIGPATAAALKRYGLTAELVPDEYRAEGVAAAIIEDFKRRGESIEGTRILLPRAAEARKILVTELQQAGAIVDEVVAYYTHSIASDDERGQNVLHLLQAGGLDIITFTSSSTVRNFMQWLAGCEGQGFVHATRLVTDNPRLTIACIGPITAQTARELGLNVTIEAREFTIDGLVEAIVQATEE